MVDISNYPNKNKINKNFYPSLLVSDQLLISHLPYCIFMISKVCHVHFLYWQSCSTLFISNDARKSTYL